MVSCFDALKSKSVFTYPIVLISYVVIYFTSPLKITELINFNYVLISNTTHKLFVGTC